MQRHVIMTLKQHPQFRDALRRLGEGGMAPDLIPEFKHVKVDRSFGAVPLRLRRAFGLTGQSTAGMIMVRGTIEDEGVPAGELFSSEERSRIQKIYADPPIRPFVTCINEPPCGEIDDVKRLLGVGTLASKGCTGEGVRLAVVDTGLRSRAKIDESTGLSVRWGILSGSRGR